jgi:predicted ATP-grasp superfamily ATP-dependent carboligase
LAKILVLGGSFLQSDFVDVALNENHQIHVLDKNPNCYLNSFKNIGFSNIDISNFDLVNTFFVKKSFDMIVSPITEIGNKVSSQVANIHGLNYNSIDTVSATTDKSVMRKILNSSNLNEPIVYRLNKETDIKQLEIKYPVIVKPTIGSASRGVTKVNNLNELNNAIERAYLISNNMNNIIFEEFIEGDQYSIETISVDRKHHVLGIVKEYLSESPYFMERFNIIDCKFNELVYNKIKLFVEELLNLLNIKYGPCHIEVKIDDELNIRLIEIASRSGMLRDRLLKTADGENYNKLIIDSYLGNTIEKIQLPKTNGCLGMVAYEEDKIIYAKAEKNNLIFDSYFLKNKSFVEKPKTLTDVVGYFFIRSSDVEIFNNYFVKL